MYVCTDVLKVFEINKKINRLTNVLQVRNSFYFLIRMSITGHHTAHNAAVELKCTL